MTINLNEYYSMLHNHDWTYEYRNNPLLWDRGEAARRELLTLARQTPRHAEMYNQFKEWGLKGGKLPPRPDIDL